MNNTCTNIPRPRAATSVATRIGDLPFRNSERKGKKKKEKKKHKSVQNS